MTDKKTERLFSFIRETIDYFLLRLEGVDKDIYFADRDKRIYMQNGKTFN